MTTEARIGVVVVAAGSSSRMEGVDKTFAPLLGRPLITHTLDRFEEFPPVSEIVLVLAAHSVEAGRALVRERGYRRVARVCAGGARRQDSVRAGLEALQPCDWVIVHDGARPGLDLDLLRRGTEAVAASPDGAAIAGVPVKDTIKVVDSHGMVTDTPPRETLWAAQTPQVFRLRPAVQRPRKLPRRRHRRRHDGGVPGPPGNHVPRLLRKPESDYAGGYGGDGSGAAGQGVNALGCTL